jgi:hypothetical protein
MSQPFFNTSQSGFNINANSIKLLGTTASGIIHTDSSGVLFSKLIESSDIGYHAITSDNLDPSILIVGAQGATGIQGIQGNQGAQGKGFKVFMSGESITGSVTNAFYDGGSGTHVGEFFLMTGGNMYCYIPGTVENSTTHDYTDFKYSGDVTNEAVLKGEQGQTGSQGAAGAAGAVGSQGFTGATGSQGAAGAVGSQGRTGATGSQGAAGAVGSQGFTGATGSQGAAGASGSQGFTGATGSQGAAGSQGFTGATGSQGSAGTAGAIGSQGRTGATGSQGAAGAAGAAGSQGFTGATGSQGSAGTAGAIGSQGRTGATGAQGAAGSQGFTGATGSQGAQGTNAGSTGIIVTDNAATTTSYLVLTNGTSPTTLQSLTADSTTGPLTYIPSTGLLTSGSLNITGTTGLSIGNSINFTGTTASVREINNASKISIVSNLSSTTPALSITDSVSANSTNFLQNAGARAFNGIVQAGDQVIYAGGAQTNENIVLTTWSTNATGVRITPNSAMIGTGGTLGNVINYTPTTNMSIDGTANTLNLTASNVNMVTAGATGITFKVPVTVGANNLKCSYVPVENDDVANKLYCDNKITSLVDAAPATLDTLNELAAALGDDANFASTVTTSLAGKASLTATQTVSGVNTFSNTSNVYYGSGANLTGINTMRGATGATGSQGTAGTAGIRGATGAQGTAGTAGIRGATGAQGADGVDGTNAGSTGIIVTTNNVNGTCYLVFTAGTSLTQLQSLNVDGISGPLTYIPQTGILETGSLRVTGTTGISIGNTINMTGSTGLTRQINNASQLSIVSNLSNTTPSLTITDSVSSNSTNFLQNAGIGAYNAIVQPGDQVIYTAGTLNQDSIALTSFSATATGVRVSPNAVMIGAGGTGPNVINHMPRTNMSIDGASNTLNLTANNTNAVSVVSNEVDFNVPVKFNSGFYLNVGTIDVTTSGESITLTAPLAQFYTYTATVAYNIILPNPSASIAGAYVMFRGIGSGISPITLKTTSGSFMVSAITPTAVSGLTMSAGEASGSNKVILGSYICDGQKWYQTARDH